MPTDRLDRTMYRLHRMLTLLLLLVVALTVALVVASCRTTAPAKPQCDVVVYGDRQPKADYGTAVVCYRGDNGKDK